MGRESKNRNYSSNVKKDKKRDFTKKVINSVDKKKIVDAVYSGSSKFSKTLSKIPRQGMNLIKFFKKNIPNLNYGVIHSQVGFSDGVSIVMQQIEDVMVDKMGIPKSNIHYLVGSAKNQSPRIRQSDIFWHKNPVTKMMVRNFKKGYGGSKSEKIEKSIELAKEEIKRFVDDKKLDVLIVHNSSHPVNFISSVALSRYYRDQIKRKRRTPKYILWWHDSHLERERFRNPAYDVNRYLMEGVPGRYVEYILFINSLQFEMARKYLLQLDKVKPGFYDDILHNHDVIYNTATTTIDSYDDLENETFTERTEKFLEEFKINDLLKKHKLDLSDVQFMLQHTRVVKRKRIDFALKYSYELFDRLKKKKMRKAMIFFVSGHSGDESDNYKRKLIELNKKLSEKYKTDKFFLVFAEDFKNTDIFFEEMPLIFARLGGIAAYFSEIEGFGNNLLEVMAAGLIPVVYTYPVFVKDIAKHKFKTVCLSSFNIDHDTIDQVVDLIYNSRKRKLWANMNIKILKKKFSYKLIAWKLKRAIIRKRIHI